MAVSIVKRTSRRSRCLHGRIVRLLARIYSGGEASIDFREPRFGKAEMASKGQDTDCANILKVLANETRLSVLKQLMDGPKNVSQIRDVLEIEKSLLSHHLKALRDLGIVETSRVGKTITYRLKPSFQANRRESGLDLGCCKLVFLER